MIIAPYIQKDIKCLYYRIKLNKNDVEFMKNIENELYQLKCIGATPYIFELRDSISTENLLLNDRLFPSVPPGHRKRKKAEFGLILSYNLKKSLDIILRIEFFKNNNIRLKDIYLRNKIGELVTNFDEQRNEYIIALELEKIYKILFSLPTKLELCKTCKYFYEYQANGYCLKYHPDTKIPNDL